MYTVFFALLLATSVQATLYVTQPSAASSCSGGKPCTVQWLDDGTAPFLSQIGPCAIGLYNGHHVLVQQIPPVDISTVHSLQFTPDPHAGPNSGAYYINFTSVNQIGNPPAHYSQFSPNFVLQSMLGSLGSPVSSDISPISVPASVLSATPNPISVTVTVRASSTASSATSVTSAGSLPPSSSQSASPSSAPPITGASGSSNPSSSASASATASSSDGSVAVSAPSSHSASPTSGSASASSSSSSGSSTPTDATPATTLTVGAQSSGFSTARATGSAPASDTVPPAPQTSGGNAPNGARALSPSVASPLSLSLALAVVSAALAFLL